MVMALGVLGGACGRANSNGSGATAGKEVTSTSSRVPSTTSTSRPVTSSTTTTLAKNSTTSLGTASSYPQCDKSDPSTIYLFGPHRNLSRWQYFEGIHDGFADKADRGDYGGARRYANEDFANILKEVRATPPPSDPVFAQLVQRVISAGDDFLGAVRSYLVEDRRTTAAWINVGDAIDEINELC
jgi:hypothetical protein